MSQRNRLREYWPFREHFGIFRLTYLQRRSQCKSLAPQVGFEPTTLRLTAKMSCSEMGAVTKARLYPERCAATYSLGSAGPWALEVASMSSLARDF